MKARDVAAWLLVFLAAEVDALHAARPASLRSLPVEGSTRLKSNTRKVVSLGV